MVTTHAAVVEMLAMTILGPDDGGRLLRLLASFGSEPASDEGRVSRSELAAALNILLFADLLRRVPTGDAYVRDVEARGEQIRFDHGALRTICLPSGPTGALPAGERAFARLLEPLGYRVAGEYPLPNLRMTDRAYCTSMRPRICRNFL